jgi:hypothetical protein
MLILGIVLNIITAIAVLSAAFGFIIFAGFMFLAFERPNPKKS